MIVHTYTHCGFMGRVLVDFFSVVCCAVLQLYQVLRPAVIQGGTVVDRPPSPDRSLARRLSIARRRSCHHYYHVPILLQHQRCVHMHTKSIVESQCMHPQLSSSPALYSCLTLR